ncbi:MAG TPA: ABC transporter ATP-binding protein [Saprospiraceae bacterium]|nr:ABC transporter ATP-binding protein [Saprospiraceae bacterium]
MEVLRLQHITKKYPGGLTPAVTDISFHVEKGEIISLVGESGSGKTTLLRLIAGLEHPDHGSIILEGEMIASGQRSLPAYKRKIGMVFQEYALFPHFNILENIIYGMEGTRQDKKKAALQWLKQVNLHEDPSKYPHQLSGGQQQRVALARALAGIPRILLLDEPFSNLDPSLKQQLRDEICMIIRQTGTTAIFVTHDTGDALAISNRIAVLQNGSLQQIDTPYKVYNEPVNDYVAGIFGILNLLEVTITEHGIQTDFGIIQTRQKMNGQEYPDQLRLKCRPEQIKIGKDKEFQLTGEVQMVGFYGDHLLLLVKSKSDQSIYMKCPANQTISEGQSISFDISEYQLSE